MAESSKIYIDTAICWVSVYSKNRQMKAQHNMSFSYVDLRWKIIFSHSQSNQSKIDE